MGLPRALPPPQISRSARLFWYAVLSLLVLVRLPSLAQPAGADQSLYSYVGTRILVGELPYRDAWDQKPPAIHFTYALLYALWPHDSVVAAADLAVALVVACLLVQLSRALGSRALGAWHLSERGASHLVAAAIFLLLGDPTLSRLAGVRVRSQCETFIAAALTAAFLIAVRQQNAPRRARPLLVGLLLGLAVTFKYNTVAYAPVLLLILVWGHTWREALRASVLVGAGMLLPIAAMVAVFGAGGALTDLYAATIGYNLEYSGETYTGPASFLAYLLTFPIQQARIDALWTVGGLGCIILLIESGRRVGRGEFDWRLLVPVAWVSAAALSIAINGSRGLPQYFVQAAPALALAAAAGAAVVWPAGRLPERLKGAARAAGLTIVAIAAWRVTDFDKIPRNAAHDLAYLSGRLPRDEHLARYGGRAEDKYSALAVARLGDYLRARTSADERVYVFGFSPGVYVQAERASASRFFWSRPVLVGFNAGSPKYGPAGLLDELRAAGPRYVVLQIHDWAPPPGDSATFFVSDPLLGGWLRSNYRRVSDFKHEDYEVWVMIASRG